jgi:hypothetical protein
MRRNAIGWISLGVLMLVATPAIAAQAPPRWAVDTNPTPTRFSAKDSAACLKGATEFNDFRRCDAYHVTLWNAGTGSSDGSPITIADSLPPGVTVQAIQLWRGRLSLFGGRTELYGPGSSSKLCDTVTVTCRIATNELGEPPVTPNDILEMVVFVTMSGASGPLTNTATISGGGVPEATSRVQNEVSEVPAPFGSSYFNALSAGVDGLPDTQAGGHPYEFTTTIDLNNEFRVDPEGFPETDTAIQDVRDVVVDLPLGLLGTVLATPQCTLAQLSSQNHCPPSTVIGHLETQPHTQAAQVFSPIYNIVPERGVAAEFGFYDLIHGSHVLYSSVVPSSAGYVLRTIAPQTPQITLNRIEATFYGNPAQVDETGNTPVAFFTNPADCSGEPLKTTIHIDSWQAPGRFNPDGTPDFSDPNWASSVSESPPVTGCNLLRFQAEEFTVKPETTTADAPTGVNAVLRFPQPETPGTLATPPLRDVSATLPPGLTIDPSAAGGLAACSEAQIGWKGVVSPENPGYSNFTEAAPTCPDASKVGTVEVTSPLIEGTLHGSLYIATQYENPYGSLLAGYFVIDDERTGTIVKVPAKLETNEATGQITVVSNDGPQIPYSELKLHGFGGARGDFATPEACGTYTTTSDMKPWSAPESGPDATPSDTFAINNGCVSGFTPAFSAGTTSNQAGSFSPFTLSISKQDDEQGLGGLTANLPTGLVGKIAGVGQCTEAQVAAAQARSAPGEGAAEAASPSCPESSLLGTVTTQTGPGPQPYSVSGKAYLTGPYKGAPYGIAIIVPAIAGPFDLGVVVIRQALFINPNDAHVTDVSDPFPTIRDGIPLRIQRVNVNLNRPNFTFNPTSCETKAITGTATSTTGTQTPLSAHYQAAGCASLAFAPSFAVSTAAKSSKANGASLFFKISYPKGAQGSQSWVREAKFNIPKQLPVRLTTIQKACLASVFDANPAACPPGSLIGHAVVHTPLLPDPLVGPVYFVSHGGAKFPDAVLVLQGDGVTVVLTGETFINGKTGVTSATFANTPDVPFENIEVTVPTGPASEFAANLPASAKGSFCGQKLVMPTRFKAQNGLEITQNTPIGVQGCSNALSVISSKVNKRTLTLSVYAPGAGRLTASGKGLSSASKSFAGREILTFTLKQKRAGRLHTKIKLTFTPSKGKKQTKSVKASFKR